MLDVLHCIRAVREETSVKGGEKEGEAPCSVLIRTGVRDGREGMRMGFGDLASLSSLKCSELNEKERQQSCNWM